MEFLKNKKLHSEFVSLGRGTFNFFKSQNFILKSGSITPSNCTIKILSKGYFYESCTISGWAFILREIPLSPLKLCKKWVWNTFESIFFPFYKHFIIMQYSLGQKRPQQIYMTLCSNLHSIPELCQISKSLTFFPDYFSQVFSIWGERSHLRVSANAQKT